MASAGTIIDDAQVRDGSVRRVVSCFCFAGALAIGAYVPTAHADESDAADITETGEPSMAMPDSLPDDPGLVTERSSPWPLRFEGSLVGALSIQPGEKNGSLAYGFGVTYGVAWASIPVMFGVDFTSVTASDNRADVVLDVPSEGSTLAATRSARDRTMCFDLWLRIQPARWAVRPYVEGFWGAKLIQSQYTLTAGSVVSETLMDNTWVMNMGWGAGVDFWGLFNAGGTVSLTLGVRQLKSPDARFRRTVPLEGRGVTVDYKMPTDAWVLMAGIMGQFDLGAKDEGY